MVRRQSDRPTCLRKDPARRYGTAEALAEDMERWLRGEPVQVRPTGALERALRRCARHLVLTGLNVYAARAAAGTVLWQLDEYAAAIERAAADPAPAALLARGDAEALRAFCQDRMEHSAFDSFFIVDKEGVLWAHHPPLPPGYIGKNYAWRDYFEGAMRIAARGRRGAHISRAFLSEGDDNYKFGISTPLRAADGTVAGVLVANVTSAARLGHLQLSDRRRVGALAALRDRDRHEAGGPLPEDRLILFHDGVEYGIGVPFVGDSARRMSQRLTAAPSAPTDQLTLPPADRVASDGDYVDPLGERDPARYGGLWLAGFAPVGDTGLIVIVQTHEEDAIELDRAPLRKLAWCGAAALLLEAVALAFTSSRERRRRAAAMR